MSVYDKIKESNQEEYEITKETYNYAINKWNYMHETKRHLEIKSLYTLQASAILVALFTGLIDSTDRVNTLHGVMLILKIIFYSTMFSTMVLLLLSLDDGIANWPKKGNNVLYKDTILPKIILEMSKSGIKSHFENLVYDFSDSISSGDVIISRKYKFFILALRSFIVAIINLIVMGLLIA